MCRPSLSADIGAYRWICMGSAPLNEHRSPVDEHRPPACTHLPCVAPGGALWHKCAVRQEQGRGRLILLQRSHCGLPHPASLPVQVVQLLAVQRGLLDETPVEQVCGRKRGRDKHTQGVTFARKACFPGSRGRASDHKCVCGPVCISCGHRKSRGSAGQGSLSACMALAANSAAAVRSPQVYERLQQLARRVAAECPGALEELRSTKRLSAAAEAEVLQALGAACQAAGQQI